MWASLAVGLLARRVASYALVALTITLFILNLRRAGERVGSAAARLQKLEHAHAIQRQMLDATVRRPRDRDDLLVRLRQDRF